MCIFLPVSCPINVSTLKNHTKPPRIYSHHPKSNKQGKNSAIIGVGNPDNWWTKDCPPQDCPPVGNPEVGNPESISHQDCPPQLLSFLWIVCAWYGPWVNAGDTASIFNHNILKNKVSQTNKIEKRRTNDEFLKKFQQLASLNKKHLKSQPLCQSSVNSVNDHHQLKRDWSSTLVWSTGFKNQSKLSNVTGVKKFSIATWESQSNLCATPAMWTI